MGARQNEEPGRLSWSGPGRCCGEGCLCSTYPGHTTAAPRAKLRIGITLGITIGRNIARNLAWREAFVKAPTHAAWPYMDQLSVLLDQLSVSCLYDRQLPTGRSRETLTELGSRATAAVRARRLRNASLFAGHRPPGTDSRP